MTTPTIYISLGTMCYSVILVECICWSRYWARTQPLPMTHVPFFQADIAQYIGLSSKRFNHWAKHIYYKMTTINMMLIDFPSIWRALDGREWLTVPVATAGTSVIQRLIVTMPVEMVTTIRDMTPYEFMTITNTHVNEFTIETTPSSMVSLYC